MAERYPVNNGAWSDPATWNGGTLPGVGDDVHLNARTVTLDQNVEVASVRTTAGAVATAGGNLSVDAPGVYVITANVIAGSSNVITVANTNVELTINGDITGSATTANVAAFNALSSTATRRFYFNGAITGGGATNAVACSFSGATEVGVVGTVRSGSGQNAHGVNLASGQIDSFTLVGDAIGGLGGNGDAVRIGPSSGSCQATITGNVTTIGTGTGVRILASVPVDTVINGDVIGGPVSNGQGVGMQPNTASCTLTINGDVYGGTTAVGASYGISIGSGGGTLNVPGKVYAGSGGGANHGINVYANTSNIFVGEVIGPQLPVSGTISSTPFAITATNAAFPAGTIRRVTFGPDGRTPLGIGRFFVTEVDGVVVKMVTEGAAVITASDAGCDYPAASDVRGGVQYEFGSSTGTLVVPSPSSVASGVPVDNTVGTAVLTASEIRAELAPELARIDVEVSSRASPDDLTDIATQQSVAAIATQLSDVNALISDIATVVGDIDSSTGTISVDLAQLVAITDVIRMHSTNRTRIDPVAKTLTVFQDDGVVPLVVFQLMDRNGSPSVDEIAERLPL